METLKDYLVKKNRIAPEWTDKVLGFELTNGKFKCVQSFCFALPDSKVFYNTNDWAGQVVDFNDYRGL